MHFDRPDGSLEFIVKYSSMTIHLFRSVSVVTHKLIELNKTCMAAILRALSTVMNEKILLIKLLDSCSLHFNVYSEPNVLHSERC